MGFWIFMLFMAELLPVLMILFGVLFFRCPPEDINKVYGYRTRRSMADQSAWNFAQRYWGKCALYTGVVELVFIVLCMLPCVGKSVDDIGIWGSVVTLVAAAALIGVPFVLTERKLRRR